MKKFKWLSIAPLAPTILFPFVASCTSAKTYEIKDYVIDLEWNQQQSQTYNILQLTDIHIANTTDKQIQYDFLQRVIDKTKEKSPSKKIDLIVITGDLFDFASKSDANEFVDFFEKQKINWTCIFGNHDQQNYFPIEWFTNKLEQIYKNNGYCKFLNLHNDDVYGNCNFVINLKHNNTNVEQLVMIDSNTYRFYPKLGYDYIHQDQIDWYDRVVKHFDMKKSLTFFHIPFVEFETYYQKAKNNEQGVSFIKDTDGNVRNKYDDVFVPKKNTDLYDHLTGSKSPQNYKYNHCQGAFVGHNHFNNFCLDIQNDKIKLCYGVKSSNKVECDDQLGGQLISLKNDGDFNIATIIEKY